MGDLGRQAKWGDHVALINPTRGPKEGLVVNVTMDGRNVTVEAKNGELVGGHEWMPARAFFVIRESFA